MKVCTDACIFGATIAEVLASKQLQADACLDLGAGTGLLSLMIAQKSLAIIDAVEIDEDCFVQLESNFKSSSWSSRLLSINADVTKFVFNKKYDLIISNPPFYEDDLKSGSAIKNIAKHDESLKLNELIKIIKTNLTKEGNFAVLLPYHRLKYFENIAAEKNLFLINKILIKHTDKHPYFRGILIFSSNKISTLTAEELIIKTGDRNYSNDFIELMRDYYVSL